VSAGHSLRRQNYSFVTVTPPVVSSTPAIQVSSTPAIHAMRVVLAVITAVALDLATFATISALITGR